MEKNYDLVGTKNAELNRTDFGELRGRVGKAHIHGD